MGVERFGDWEKAKRLLMQQPGARLALAIRQATIKAAILLVREIQRGIRSQAPGGQPFAKLAESTIRRKGSSKALIDTGFLINSITHRILRDRAFIGLLKTTTFRALLEEHRRDIQSRLERLERELDRKSDKDTVELMITGVREDLRRHSEDIKCLYVGLSTKVSAETMWKVAGLVISLGGIIAGIVSFLLGLLVRR